LITAVCVSMCLSVPRRIPALLHGPDVSWGNARGALKLCIVGRIYNRCTGFVAMRIENIARTQNVSECLYSLYAWCSFINQCDIPQLTVTMTKDVSRDFSTPHQGVNTPYIFTYTPDQFELVTVRGGQVLDRCRCCCSTLVSLHVD